MKKMNGYKVFLTILCVNLLMSQLLFVNASEVSTNNEHSDKESTSNIENSNTLDDIIIEDDVNDTDNNDIIIEEPSEIETDKTIDEDSNIDIIDANLSKDLKIGETQISEFSVIIPKTIILDENKQGVYDISISGIISETQNVTVTPEANLFIMQDQNFSYPKNDVVAYIVHNKDIWGYDDVISNYVSSNNLITAPDLTAGSWRGTFSFIIALEGVSSLSMNEISSKNIHIHDYTSEIIKEPTDTENGTVLYICECRDSFMQEIDNSKHIHSYITEITESTELINESITYTCTECGDSFEKIILATQHSHEYIETITKEPTITEEGIKTFTCECGETFEQLIPTIEHMHTYIETITEEPTISKTGIKTFTCECGETYDEIIPILVNEDVIESSPENPSIATSSSIVIINTIDSSTLSLNNIDIINIIESDEYISNTTNEKIASNNLLLIDITKDIIIPDLILENIDINLYED